MRFSLLAICTLLALTAQSKTRLYLRPELGFSVSNVILSATPPPGYIATLNYSYSAQANINGGAGLLITGKYMEVATGIYYYADGASLQHIRSVGAPTGSETYKHIMLPVLVAARLKLGTGVRLAPGLGLATVRNTGYKNHLYYYNSNNVVMESSQELSAGQMDGYYKRNSTLFIVHANLEVKVSKDAMLTFSARLNNMLNDIDEELYSDTRIRTFTFSVGYGLKL